MESAFHTKYKHLSFDHIMLKSFIEIPPESDFPIQNLPYGIFSTKENPSPRMCTRLGDFAVDLAFLDEQKLFDQQYGFFAGASLNRFMSAGRETWRRIRQRLTDLLSEGGDTVWEEAMRVRALIPVGDVHMHLPESLHVRGARDVAENPSAFNRPAQRRR